MENVRAWTKYFEMVDVFFGGGLSNSYIKEKGYYSNKLDALQVDKLKTLADEQDNILFSFWDKVDNFSYNKTTWQDRDYVNRNFGFKVLSEEFKWGLQDAMELIESNVKEKIGSNFSVVSARVWDQYYQSFRESDSYSLGWHTDDFPKHFYKVLIYLTPLNSDYGTTKIRCRGKEISIGSDDPGTWLLFNPSDIMHKGEPPLKKGCSRLTIEVTISPSFSMNLRIPNVGVNSKVPLSPWSAISSVPLIKRKSCIYKKNNSDNVSGFRDEKMKRVEVFGNSAQEFFNGIMRMTSILNSEKGVILYGEGSVAKILYPQVKDNVRYIVDMSKVGKISTLNGSEIISIQDLSKNNCSEFPVVVTPIGRKAEIQASLLNTISNKLIFVEDFL